MGGPATCIAAPLGGTRALHMEGSHSVGRKKRIMVVFGTRPEAIKMAPVYRALHARQDVFDTLCCVTAQHRQMLDQALRSFAIVPDIDLDLMRHDQGLADVKAAVILAMTKVLRDEQPDLLLVHGDTTTSMASATAAFYASIPVGHVEAGLRSRDLRAPFPEEFNRRVTSMIARYHFAPTELNKANLIEEGCDPGAIFVTGNTVIDALQYITERHDAEVSLRREAAGRLDIALPFDWRADRYVVVTCHRRENFSQGLQRICEALRRLAAGFPAVHFLCPAHPNPVVRGALRKLLHGFANVHVIEPLPYDAFLHMMRSCHSVVTDSGGLQEEAPAIGKPVLVMREVTERPEAIAAGGVKLVGSDTADIVAGVSALLTDERLYRSMASATNPFGDGTASRQIADVLERVLRPSILLPA
jgi:UDP-N-acetylglucosamine 2-epimerase (non-hydrolysing)